MLKTEAVQVYCSHRSAASQAAIADVKSIAFYINSKLCFEFHTEAFASVCCNRRSLSVLSVKLGDIFAAEGNYQKAEEEYLNDLERRKTLDSELDMDWTKRDLSLIYERLGDLYRTLRQDDKASEMYEESIRIADELADKTGMPVHAQELSKLCTKLGEFYLDIGDCDEAVYYLDNAL